MKIVVCFKIVPEESEIQINADRTLNLDGVPFAVSQYDCNAIEAAMRAAASYENAEVIALTVGGERVENGKVRKAALSRGPAKFVAVKGEGLDMGDSYAVAETLRSAIDAMGGADLVICGEGSGDMYRQQTGAMLGALLGAANVNAVSGISAGAEGTVRVERTLEDCAEVLDVRLPAVLSVTSYICPSKIPSMRDIMGAGKKPAEITESAGQPCAVESLGILAPEQTDRRQEVIKGDSEDDIKAFYELIQKALL